MNSGRLAPLGTAAHGLALPGRSATRRGVPDPLRMIRALTTERSAETGRKDPVEQRIGRFLPLGVTAPNLTVGDLGSLTTGNAVLTRDLNQSHFLSLPRLLLQERT